MAHWKLTLSYDGTGFHGWQVQPGLPTIQGCLAEALQRIAGESVLPQGSGRTDAGVHALAQVASFSLEAAIPSANLQRALNSVLPPGIRITASEMVSADFHARHSALRKTYEYRLFEKLPAGLEPERVCPPFIAPYAWDCRWRLDASCMQAAAARLIGEHDFASFAASDPDRTARGAEDRAAGERAALNIDPRETTRTVSHSDITREGDLLLYRVTGSGFLHHMVRNIVGTLVDVGRGSLTLARFEEVLSACDRTKAGPTAPPQGLFLVSVEYTVPAG